MIAPAPSRRWQRLGRPAEHCRLPEDACIIADVVPAQEEEEAEGQRTLLQSRKWRDSGRYLRRAFGEGEEPSRKTSEEERCDRQPNPCATPSASAQRAAGRTSA